MSFTSFLTDRQADAKNRSDAQQHTTSSQLFGSTSFQSTATPSSASTSAPAAATSADPAAPSASDLFQTAAFDPARLHPLAQLGDNLDYLALDDAKLNETPGAQTALPSRGWSDELCYGTGTTYLSGLAIGGLWGLREGAFRPLGTASSTKLRINSILNACTRRGTFMGNSLGVLALFYNAVNATIDSYRGQHDLAGGLAAGAISGALFRAPGEFTSRYRYCVSSTLMSLFPFPLKSSWRTSISRWRNTHDGSRRCLVVRQDAALLKKRARKQGPASLVWKLACLALVVGYNTRVVFSVLVLAPPFLS